MHTQNLDRSRFRFITEQTELLPGVFLFPSIDIINQEDTHFERFWVQQEDGCKIPDTFQDELAMVLVEPEGFSVLSACSHRGITNILRTVQAAFPESPCKLLLGGFHIHNAEKQKYQVIADYLQEYLPRQIGVCHCTGVDKYAFFYKDFGDSTFYNYTGKLIQTMLLPLCGCVMHVFHRMDQKLFFVTRVTFIKSLHKEEQLFNSPHKPLMKPIRFGRPMASKLRLPVTGMEILICSLCLLTEVPPGG